MSRARGTQRASTLGVMLEDNNQETIVNKFSNLVALLIGIVICFIVLFTAEMISRFIEPNRPSYHFVHPNGYYDEYDFGVKRPRRGMHRLYEKKNDEGRYIYDVTISVDEKGRRITPVKNKDRRHKFALFFGGSFTYGEGVEDDETLPFWVGDMTSTYMPYNYGFHGLGPFDALAKLENIDFKNEVQQGNGILIYTFIEGHIHRTIGSMAVMGWMADGPYYKENKEGSLVRAGTFETGRPFLTRFYKLLRKSKLLDTFNISLPPRFTDNHVKLVAKAFKAMNKKFTEIYPKSSFYVLIYPGKGHEDILMHYLDKYHVQYLDYSDLFNKRESKYYLAEEDRHPTPLAYNIISAQLVKDLNLR